MRRRRLQTIVCLALAALVVSCGMDRAWAVSQGERSLASVIDNKLTRMRQEARNTSAAIFKKNRAAAIAKTGGIGTMAMDPGGIPHYFGPYPNWANSPVPRGPITGLAVTEGGSGYTSPTVTIWDVWGTGSGATATATVAGGVVTGLILGNAGAGYSAPIVTISDAVGTGATGSATIGDTPASVTGGIRKFVDSLPGLDPAGANNLGQYMPVAVPDTTTYLGSDYYEIELREYTEKLHSDLPATKLRGYVQVVSGVPLTPIHYLGPLIVAQRDRPVRIKFTNKLPTAAGGDLFLPVDTTVMGAGMGPLDMPGMPGMKESYTQNRATLHLHGGATPWISDGTVHQWTTPAGEMTSYPHGVSVYNAPDMPNPGPDPPQGELTFYYTNQQSARLMFYHDHSFGITRLNVYAGEAAGYLITDQVEQDLISGANVSGVNPGLQSLLPDIGIPLIIQDKSFVDPTTIAAQDPTWNWGATPGTPQAGDLWYPHVYVPAQNPYDITGANPFGRWHYGPWFWPPLTNLMYPPVPNPYYDPINAPWEPPEMPGTPNVSMAGEAFMDTPMVNGTPYPYLEVDPKAYRFRILNAADDRFFSLQMYVADSAITTPDGRTNTEVRMVPAAPTAGFPATWPTDGRDGGVPDPATTGPAFIQIGTEGGFLPAPVVVPNQPIDWNMTQTAFNFGNVTSHALLLGTAERADVIVDFSAFAGQTLILYNDAPAAFPALDERYDYYTGAPNLTDTGGAPPPLPGFGPNTRTVMQIRVRNITPSAPYDLAALEAAFAKTGAKRGVFEVSQDPIIMPDATYSTAYNNTTFPADTYVRQQESSKTFKTVSGATLTLPFEAKAIQDEMSEAYDEYGRMSGMLGLELPYRPFMPGFVLYGFSSPPVDIVMDSVTPMVEPAPGDGTQLWKITHNGVDTHTIHFHLFNVQLINRVAWDNAIMPPDPNELGWKETIRVNPLEHTIVAFRPVQPTAPFKLPNNVRMIDPTMPEGTVLKDAAMAQVGGFDPSGEPVTIINHSVNFGHEYVWHCHILAHEEMDMMHAMIFAVKPDAPSNLAATLGGGNATLNWTDNSLNETSFVIQRANDAGFTLGLTNFSVGQNVTIFVDNTIVPGPTYYYRVRADNLVGDTTVYPTPAIGFPTKLMSSAYSNTAPADQPPVAPSNLIRTALTATSAALAWTDNSSNETAFRIQRASNIGFTSSVRTFTVAANRTTYTDTTIPSNAAVYFRVRAENAYGPSSWSNILFVDSPPAGPTNLRLVGRTRGSITMTWTDRSNNEYGFYVERSTVGSGGPWTRIATVATPGVQYINTGLHSGTTYWYRVQAYNARGRSSYTNVFAMSTLP